ncbi:MAG: polyhydroxyalkanoate synthesis regulator phasin [Flavobacteriales bacterium]|jgi:polyhydroxyalkanoate synthesis regulator phasin
MNNIEMIKDKASQAEVMTRKVFLAGLGAYGKSFEETKSRFESLSTESNKMFSDLVAKGETLETQGKSKFSDVQTKISAKADINTRVEALRSKLGLNKTSDDQKIEALNTKIDSLTAAIAKLTSKSVVKPTVKMAATQ